MCNIARLLLAFCLLSVYYVVIALYSFCHMYCIVQDRGLEFEITNALKFFNGKKIVYAMKAKNDNR
jgi:hypothetical protein